MAKKKATKKSIKTKPELKTVVHIPFVKISDHFSKDYKFDQDAYWSELCDDHMFRGNNSSKSFYCQFLEEVISEEVLSLIPVDEKLKEILLNDEPKNILKYILKTQPKAFLDQYEQLVLKKDEIVQALGKKNKYYFGYFIRGLVESAIISEYKIKDYDIGLGSRKYYYHFSW